MDNGTCKIVSENDPPSPAALHCVLVHGTFATDAKWTFPDAPLATGLRNLEPGGVQFHRFVWSGDNTHTARCVAAAEIGSRLRELAAKYPDSRFLLVGHSHGGNVACAGASTLQDMRCAGIVTLATPFFHVIRRSLAPVAVLPSLLWALLAASWIGYGGSWMGEFAAKANHWLYGRWAEAVGSHWLYHIWSVIVAIATMFFIGGFLFVGAILLYKQSMERLSARQDTYFHAWDQLRPFPVSILSLSMTLDEAFWSLRGARILPEWLHMVWECIHRHLAIAITITSLPMGIAFVVIYLRESEIPIISDAVAPHALIGGAWAVAAAYVVMVILWLLVVLLTYIFQRFTYGLNGIEHHLMVNVSIHRIPQIKDPKLVRHRNIALPLRQFLSEQFGLIHSKLYMDSRSIKEIIVWYRMLPSHQSRAFVAAT